MIDFEMRDCRQAIERVGVTGIFRFFARVVTENGYL
jgi:hypothetical protein